MEKNIIQFESSDGIYTITVDRPDALNAMNPKILRALTEAIQTADSDDEIGVILLTGSGDKAFIAGADIKEMSQLNVEEARVFANLGKILTDCIEHASKPVIAVINGFALGGGCEISLACHIRFASETAMFAQPEVKLGLIPGWGGTQRLPRIVGKGIATELIISGHMIDAKEAHRIGLVNRIFPQNTLLAKTKYFAKSLLKNGPNAMCESLRCINESSERKLSDGLVHEVESFAQLFSSEEAKEGLKAFVEKRPAAFRPPK